MKVNETGENPYTTDVQLTNPFIKKEEPFVAVKSRKKVNHRHDVNKKTRKNFYEQPSLSEI